MKLPMKSLMLVFSVALFLAPRGMADVRYSGWEHSGPLWINTTPEGANLPAGAVVVGGGAGVFGICLWWEPYLGISLRV